MADRTLAPSTSSVHALIARGVPRVQRWGRGVDVTRFSPRHADQQLREALAPNGELIVGYVDRLAPEKQVDRLAAAASVPGVRVVIVGDGPAYGSLRALMPSAVFLGARYGGELSAAYATMDVFAHTGPHETFCQAVQEALASGLAVLAPDAGGPRDLITHGHNGFLLPVHRARFADQLRSRVDALRRDRLLLRRLGQAARSSVLGRSWPALCDELIDHYGEVSGVGARSQERHGSERPNAA